MDFALKHRRSSFRLPSNSWLILIAAALVFGATYGVLCKEESRLRDERLAALDSQAHFAAVSVDTRIEIEIQQLRELAASDLLKRGQLEEFFKEAHAFAQRIRRQVVLLDVPSNTQVFNSAAVTRLQDRARFMQKSERDSLRPERPYISSLFYAPNVQKYVVAVGVPISEEGRVLYLLGVALDPAEILAALREVNFVDGTVSLIVDRSGSIVARSAEHDKFMGRKAPRNMAARAEKSGRLKGATFDGTPIILSYLQSELTGWAAVSFVPDRTDSQWPQVAALLAALFTVVCGSIFVIARHAAKRPIRKDES